MLPLASARWHVRRGDEALSTLGGQGPSPLAQQKAWENPIDDGSSSSRGAFDVVSSIIVSQVYQHRVPVNVLRSPVPSTSELATGATRHISGNNLAGSYRICARISSFVVPHVGLSLAVPSPVLSTSETSRLHFDRPISPLHVLYHPFSLPRPWQHARRLHIFGGTPVGFPPLHVLARPSQS